MRNRARYLIAANARWDREKRYDALLDELLRHITDEKPITARQCLQALPEVAAARPELIPRIRAALESADITSYRDSMCPLLQRDIQNAL
ncbi:MAG: SufBD protein, partial [Oscillospiraceae bacterium]|nr:SufBD protein [Oscillospiraceae bacterium]